MAAFACMLITRLCCNDEKNNSCKLVYAYYKVIDLFVVNVHETHFLHSPILFCVIVFKMFNKIKKLSISRAATNVNLV